MNIIYIIEDGRECNASEEKYVPNFTMPGKESGAADENIIKNSTMGTASAMGVASVMGAAVSAAKFGILSAFPIPLLIAAAISSPQVSNLFKKDNEDLADSIGDIEINEFLCKHAFTSRRAKELEYSFPPGHPQVGQTYIEHPLSGLAGRKKNVYIPYDKYDSILLEEREAELIRLLVTLGATRILITKNRGSDFKKSLGLDSELELSIFKCSISGNSTVNDIETCTDKREYILDGSDLKKGQSIDRSLFAWIDFEPSWESLVFAREVGGCTKAELDIKENAIFSIDKSIEASVKFKVYEGSIPGEFQKINNNYLSLAVGHPDLFEQVNQLV